MIGGMRDTIDLIERVSQLRSRSAEVSARMRRDADQFAEIHHDLADALSRLLPLYETALRARSAAPEAPRSPLRMLRLAEVAQQLSLSRS